MPVSRPVTVQELRSFASFVGKPEGWVSEIEAKVAEGAVLEVQESTFSDPGSDYMDVRLAGKSILYIPGY